MITYCRVYEPEQVAGHPAAATALAGRPTPAEVVYLWTDLSVTAAPFPDVDVVLAASDEPAWVEFCTDRLGFVGPPADIVEG